MYAIKVEYLKKMFLPPVSFPHLEKSFCCQLIHIDVKSNEINTHPNTNSAQMNYVPSTIATIKKNVHSKTIVYIITINK